jgi:uncharacterized CHY-type Zn-finger protein
MCFGIKVNYTRREISISELHDTFICKYCKKKVYETVIICPYCTCKLGHTDCITNTKCPICKEEFDIGCLKKRIFKHKSVK